MASIPSDSRITYGCTRRTRSCHSLLPGRLCYMMRGAAAAAAAIGGDCRAVAMSSGMPAALLKPQRHAVTT